MSLKHDLLPKNSCVGAYQRLGIRVERLKREVIKAIIVEYLEISLYMEQLK